MVHNPAGGHVPLLLIRRQSTASARFITTAARALSGAPGRIHGQRWALPYGHARLRLVYGEMRRALGQVETFLSLVLQLSPAIVGFLSRFFCFSINTNNRQLRVRDTDTDTNADTDNDKDTDTDTDKDTDTDTDTGGGEAFNQSWEVSPSCCRVAQTQTSPLEGVETSPHTRELLH